MLKKTYLYSIIIIILVTVATGIMGCSRREVDAFRCDMCGMDVGKSETKYRIKVTEGEKYACGFSCANMLNENLKDKIIAIETVDFQTGNFININTAAFVAHSDVIPKGSMPPSVLAFSKKEDAEHFVKQHKGKVLDLESIKRLMAEERAKR